MPKQMNKVFERSKSRATGKDHIKTVERLIMILSRLDKGGSLSTGELDQKLGVTQRTIQRDLDLLSRSGYPIIEKERGRYVFIDGFSLKKVELSEEQASLLSFMFDISHSLGSKFEDSFRGLFKRVMAREVETPFYAKLPAGIKIPCDARIVKDLEDAIYDCERIQKVEHTSEAFVPPANLMTLLDQSVNIWFEDKRGERVLIKVAPEASKYFKQKIYFPLQKIVKEEKDGGLLLETFPGHPEEISHIVMNWIPCLRVLEPESFNQDIKKTVTGYLTLIN